MCRIAYSKATFPHALALKVYDTLERSNGGHGNGYWHKDLEQPVRGVKVSVKDSATAVSQYGGSFPFLWHTRITSQGQTCDDQNHPHLAGDFGALVHNGTWLGWQRFSKDAQMDSQAMAEIVAQHGPGALMAKELSGAGVMLIAHRDGTATLVKRSGTFYLHYLSDNAGFIHASEPIDKLVKCDLVVEVPNDMIFKLDVNGLPRSAEGIPLLDVLEVVNPTTGTKSSYSRYDADDEKYDDDGYYGWQQTRNGYLGAYSKTETTQKAIEEFEAKEALKAPAVEQWDTEVDDFFAEIGDAVEEGLAELSAEKLLEFYEEVSSRNISVCVNCPLASCAKHFCPVFNDPALLDMTMQAFHTSAGATELERDAVTKFRFGSK